MRLNEKKAAQYMGISAWILRQHRVRGNPLIRYMDVGGRPWYDTKDLDAYMKAATVERGNGG